MKFYTKGDFYFDIDLNNQFRITGPENHLLFGLSLPYDVKPTIESYRLLVNQLEVKINVGVREITLPFPLVTDIRTLRNFTEGIVPHPTYRELVEKKVSEVMPQSFHALLTREEHQLVFENSYHDPHQEIKEYGSLMRFPASYHVSVHDNFIHLKAAEPILLTIQTITNIRINNPLTAPVFEMGSELPTQYFSDFLLELYEESRLQVEHLIRTRKTSSFEYGTLFPRDWIESANLGEADLTPETIDYMYEQSMFYVSELGEGWHEEVIGQYQTKIKDPADLIDRKMIDIETLYIMGVPKVSRRFLAKEENVTKLRAVGQYILNNAQQYELISFKRHTTEGDRYHQVGNWRDSETAFPGQKSPLAPYDVNCVFYPVSLKIMSKYKDVFNLEDTNPLEQLIEKWRGNRHKFQLYHPGDLIGYSLALHGSKRKPMPVAHLDESYALFYDEPTLEEVVSFAKKIVDPDFFYTPAGPILVAADEEELTTKHYHGQVIWPKQAAFAVGGLAIQYRRGQQENWPEPVMETIRGALLVTCESCFKGWEDMQAVPELYYYDREQNKARFYTDQEGYEGQMSLIQLWSSVGCRRIMREYAFIKSTD